MSTDDQQVDPTIPPVISAARAETPPTDYMSGQISVMRRENPEVWKRIDELTDGNFNAKGHEHLLISQKSECDGCGYNLYGNLSGVCPECGTPVHGSAEMRRLLSIRIFDALRTAMPQKWADVAARFERRRMETVEREFSEEGARRDEIRKRAMQNWLDRKRGESNPSY